MKKISIISLTLALTLSLVACSDSETQEKVSSSASNDEITTTNMTTSKKEASQATTIPDDAYGNYSENDILSDYDENEATKISFSGNSADISGEGAKLTDGILTISNEGTYVLSGDFDGQVKVEADEQNVRIVLNGVSLTSSDGPALFVSAAKNTYITLAENTENTLIDGENYTLAEGEDEPDATIFSKSDLTINGLGILNVTGNYKNGIRSKDDLVITGGKINVTAKNDGIKGKDSVSVLDGVVSITTLEGDGIQSNNATDPEKGWIGIDGGTFTILSGQDGVQAETTLSIKTAEMTVASTDLTAEKNDEISQKGLKATGAITVDNGNFSVETVDDSLHSNDTLTINNGTFTISSQDDGIHADKDLIINDGKITVAKSYEGLEGKTVQIKGGTHLVNASDDGINASDPDAASEEGGGMPGGMGGNVDEAVYIDISGGNTVVSAAGDGIDSNANVNMSDGVLIVEGPVSGGNGSLDYDGTWNQTGGTLLTLGGQDMAMAPSDSSSQASLAVYLDSTEKESITIKQDTDILFSYTPSKEYSQIVASSPSFTDGKDVTITLGGTITGDAVNNYVAKPTIKDDTDLGTYTLNGIVTSLSQNGEAVQQQSMGGAGGRGGGTPPK